MNLLIALIVAFLDWAFAWVLINFVTQSSYRPILTSFFFLMFFNESMGEQELGAS